jgi:tight adherence protein C
MLLLHPFIADVSPGAGFQVAGSALAGAAVAAVAWWVACVLRSEDLLQGIEWRYDISRINELRRADWFYRLFQPLLQPLGRMNRNLFRDGLPAIYREIQAAGLSRFWLPEEYLAKLQLIALALAPLLAYVFVGWMGGAPGLVMALLTTALTAWVLRRRLAARARDRLREIKRRMPFLLDLLTLLMEAGSTFLGALRQAVEEFEGHPVAQEFGRTLADMNLGKTRTEALEAMRDRLADDEITSIIGSIIQGEYLGTPLANVFRTQADVLRIKRTQRAETLAGEAGVNMLLPAVLVMAATVLIIIGPFLLNYLSFGLSL